MDKKTMGIVLLVVGAVILAVSLLADTVGIGEGTAFGFKQILGSAAGAIVAAIGLVMMLGKGKEQ